LHTDYFGWENVCKLVTRKAREIDGNWNWIELAHDLVQ